MLVLPHPRPKGLGESQESGLPQQREGSSAQGFRSKISPLSNLGAMAGSVGHGQCQSSNGL